MTKFENRGVEFQMDARNKEQARRSFQRSCDCCCNMGMHLDCDRCAIAEAHKNIIAIFDSQEQAGRCSKCPSGRREERRQSQQDRNLPAVQR